MQADERLLSHDEAELLAAAVRSSLNSLNGAIVAASQAGLRIEIGMQWKQLAAPDPTADDVESGLLGVFRSAPDFNTGCIELSIGRISRDL